MFERAMEEEDAYSYGELQQLCRNPVTAGILGRLVFVGAEAAASVEMASAVKAGAVAGAPDALIGTLEELATVDPALAEDTKLLVAHPITLYRLGVLPKYQRLFFEKQQASGTKQP